jgi:hypothetical protein
MTEERRSLNRRGGDQPAFDRRQVSQGVRHAQEDSFKNRDSSGKWITIFREVSPQLPFWPCPDGAHVVDFIPYRVGSNHPRLPKGDFTYVLDVYVHKNVGVEEGTYLCMAKTYGEPCPVCEFIKEAKRGTSYDEQLLKDIKVTRRAIYNLVEITSDQTEAKGIQIWDVAHYYIEAELTVLAQDPRDATGSIPFADPDVGKSFSFVKATPKGSPPSYKGLKFLDRKSPLADNLLLNSFCLDDLLIKPKFNDLREILEKGVSSTPKTERNEERPPVDSSSGEKISDAPPSVSSEQCPHGHKFGEDCELFPDCLKCELYNKCADAYEALNKK